MCENNSFNGLTTIHLELTSRCNKDSCWMCGRRKIEKEAPHLMSWGDMPFELVEKISKEIPKDITIQFFNNGEPLLYPRFSDVLDLFPNNIKCINTNGKLLLSKQRGLKDFKFLKKLDTLTISVIENDPQTDEQYKIVKHFLEGEGTEHPLIIFRLLGDISIDWLKSNEQYEIIKDISRQERWYDLAKIYNCLIATRILHNPLGSFDYQKKVTIPETGICQDLLHHLAIDRYGKVSICVRFDPNRYGVIGDVNKESLIDIWNCDKRKYYIKEHLKGNRNCNELCNKCSYYGVPTGN